MSEGKSIDFESTIDGKKVKLKLIQENLDIERRCDTEYHIAYTELMGRGIMPRSTLEKIMEKKGIWSQEDEERLSELQGKLAKLHIQLEAANTHDDGITVASEMGKLRAECLKLVEVKAAVLANSCESLADQIRRDAYLAYGTVYADTKKKVFLSYEDFLGRSEEQVVLDARSAMLKAATESFNSSLTGLPEVSYIRDVEKYLEDESREQADAKAEADAATATKKKPVTRKKTTAKKVTTKKKAPAKKTQPKSN